MFTDQNQARELLQASCLDPTQLQHLLNFSFNVDIALARSRREPREPRVFQSEATCFMCVFNPKWPEISEATYGWLYSPFHLYNGHIYPLAGLGRQCIPQSEWIERLANWTPRFDKHLVLCHIVHPSFNWWHLFWGLIICARTQIECPRISSWFTAVCSQKWPCICAPLWTLDT